MNRLKLCLVAVALLLPVLVSAQQLTREDQRYRPTGENCMQARHSTAANAQERANLNATLANCDRVRRLLMGQAAAAPRLVATRPTVRTPRTFSSYQLQQVAEMCRKLGTQAPPVCSERELQGS